MSLTVLKLKSLHGKPYEGKPEISDGDGLSIRVSPKGKITFQFRYRFGGKPARIKLGDYPYMGLSDARNKRDEYLNQLSNGKDPRSVRAIQLIRRESVSLDDCIDFWNKSYCSLKRKNSKATYRRIVKRIDKKWLDVCVNELDVTDFSRLFSHIAKRHREDKASSVATAALTELRSVLRYCVRQGKIENTSFEGLKLSDYAEKPPSRDRVLNDSEIGMLWIHSEEVLSMEQLIALRMTIVFGCRRGELVTARKSDFDTDELVWTIPKENTKTNKVIKRPIPASVEPLISDWIDSQKGSPWFFPNKKNENHISPKPLANIPGKCEKYLGIEDFVLHDFRRTISTRLTDFGCPIYITEKILGHHLGGIMAVYNKSEMLDEMAKWLDVWVEHIAKCADDVKHKNPRAA